MNESLFPSCVYTIRHSQALKESYALGGKGEFTERGPWTTGSKIFVEARKKNQRVAVVFAPAEGAIIDGVIYWALIDEIALSPQGTTVHFSSLQPFSKRHRLSSLKKLSNGEPLSDGYIRPYVPCRTPAFLQTAFSRQRDIASAPDHVSDLLRVRRAFPDGVTKQDILEAIAKYDAGERQGFGKSKDFDILFQGRRYPPKAIGGIAASRVVGRPLTPVDFSAGDGQKCYKVLQSYGFQIVPKRNSSSNDNLSNEELRAAVAAYLEMLQSQIPPTIQVGRFPMQSISATLQGLGLRWIRNFKPRGDVSERILGILAEQQPETYAAFVPTTDENEVKEKTAQILRTQPNLEKPLGNPQPKITTRPNTQRERSPAVRAYVLLQAKGCCELCGSPAPFVDAAGVPFLEVHHVWGLGEDGPDIVENAVALCPNCHRLLHHGKNMGEANASLFSKVMRLVPRPQQPADNAPVIR
jgi:5-methylcytosine-specific restriction protein A